MHNNWASAHLPDRAAVPAILQLEVGRLALSASTSLLDLGRANARPLFLRARAICRARSRGLPLARGRALEAGDASRRERRCPTPSCPRAGDHRRAGRRARAEARRIRAHPRPDRAGADAHRARHLLGDVERALLVQVLEEVAAHAADHRPAGDLRPGRECRRRRYRRRAGAWSSRWRATTTPPTSSPTRARRPGWAASCATSSPWARGPSRR